MESTVTHGEADVQTLLSEVLYLAREMVENGAEIRRVEDTMTRICRAYGLEVLNSYAVLSMAELTVKDADGGIYSQSARVSRSSTDLGRIEALNSLARRICADRPAPAVIHEKLRTRERHRFASLFLLLGYLLDAGGFAFFFGCDLPEILVCLFIGVGIFCMDHFLRLKKQNAVLYTLLACFVAGCLAKTAQVLGLIASAEAVMVGDVMLFIPTLSVVNGVREIIYRDITTGLCRLTEALMTALAIGGGYAAAILVFGGFGA